MNRNSKIFFLIMLFSTMFIFSCSKFNDSAQENLYNNIGFEYSNTFVDLSPVKSDINDNMIFFVGETHGIRENIVIKKEFLMYLKENGNIKYLLSEESAADAYLHNKYLKTGDITIIDKMYENLKGTFAWNKDSYEFEKWMYEYNQLLPEEDKIMYVGCDVVHQHSTALKVLQEIFNNYDVPEEIKDTVEEFNSMYTYGKLNDKDLKKLNDNSEKLLAIIQENEEEYSNNYGENFMYLLGTLKGIVRGLEAKANENGDFYEYSKYRDKAMYEIFNVYYEYLPVGKYFGQWGNAHTYQKSPTDVKWFTTYLEEDERFKDNIVTVHLNYEKCMAMRRNGTEYIEKKCDDFDNENKLIKKEYSQSNKLYKLNEDGSVFSEKLIYNFNPYLVPTEGVTTDYIQYFIKIKRGKAMKPLS